MPITATVIIYTTKGKSRKIMAEFPIHGIFMYTFLFTFERKVDIFTKFSLISINLIGKALNGYFILQNSLKFCEI